MITIHIFKDCFDYSFVENVSSYQLHPILYPVHVVTITNAHFLLFKCTNTQAHSSTCFFTPKNYLELCFAWVYHSSPVCGVCGNDE